MVSQLLTCHVHVLHVLFVLTSTMYSCYSVPASVLWVCEHACLLLASVCGIEMTE